MPMGIVASARTSGNNIIFLDEIEFDADFSEFPSYWEWDFSTKTFTIKQAGTYTITGEVELADPDSYTFVLDVVGITITWQADVEGEVDDDPLVTFEGTNGGQVNITSGSIVNDGNGGAITSEVDITIAGNVTIDGYISLEGTDNDLTISYNFTIPTGSSLAVGMQSGLVIGSSVTFTNNGTILNHGEITNEGTIANNGTITEDGEITNTGIINNNIDGTISITGTFSNTGGTVNNRGSITSTVEAGGNLNHAVTYSVVSGTGGGVSITAGNTLTPDDGSVTLTAAPSANYRVRGWTVNTMSDIGNTTNYLTIDNITEPKTVTVEFELVPRTISFDANGGTGTMTSETVQHGSTYSIKANEFTRDYHAFAGWSTSSGSQAVVYAGGATTSAVTADITLFAQWKPVITIATQPATTTPVTFGAITGNLTVVASVGGAGSTTYQWYSNTTASNTGGSQISGATSATFAIPTNLTPATYYYYVVVSSTGADSVTSNYATVTVATADQTTLTINSPGAKKFGVDTTPFQLYTTGGSGSGGYTFNRTSGTAADVSPSGEVTIVGAGTIQVTVTKAGDTNFNPTTSVALPITIDEGDQAPLTIIGATTLTYGSTLQLGTEGGTYGDVTYALYGGSNTGGAVSSTGYVTTTGVGEITVRATRDGGANFNPVTSGSHVITITAAPLTGAVSIDVNHSGGSNPDLIDEGDVLTANVSAIYPAGARAGLSYQWYRDGGPIASETNPTYTVGNLSEDPVDTEITVRVTATGNFTGSETSAPIVIGRAPLAGSISINSSAGTGEGDTLTLVTSSLLPASAQFDIVWRRDGAPIPGATNDTYVITMADTGRDIYVFITATGDFTGSMSSLPVSIPAVAPVIESVNNATAILGVQRTFQVVAKGTSTSTAPLSYSLTGDVPLGVSINPSNGLITILSTTPRGTGTHTFNVVASNTTSPDAIQSFTLTVISNNRNVLSVTTPSGAVINQSAGTITATVSNSTVSQVIAVTVCPYAGWELYSDFACTNAISNTIPLNVGPNTVYLRVTAENGDSRVYTVTITRVPVPAPTPDPEPDDLPDGVISQPDTITVIDDHAEIVFEGHFDDLHAAYKNNAKLILTPSNDGKIKYLSGWVGFNGRIGEATAGSTIITIYDDFLKTLPNGIYTFSVDFIDGKGVITTATATYVIHLAVNNNPPLLQHSWIPASATNGFTDVPNSSWQNAAVSWAENNVITKGSGSSTIFKPNDDTTRAEFVTFLHRVYGTPAATATPFGDMPANTDFRNAILWARAEGVTTGVGNNMFSPSGNITREQVAVMLYRLIGDKTPAPIDVLDDFTDADKISTWTDAEDAVNWAAYYGIMGLNTDKTLNPGGNATRAEAITMIYRAVIVFGIPAP
jgi:hypothetical protein